MIFLTFNMVNNIIYKYITETMHVPQMWMKRETGVNPVRSRHCKRELLSYMSLPKWREDDKMR